MDWSRWWKGKTEYFRRKHNINFVRYADDFIITANNREVLEQLTPAIEAFLSERGVNLSKEKTKITPLSEGFDFPGQTVRKHTRHNGKAGKLQITPSKASFQAIKLKIKTLCKCHKGVKPEELINKLNPVLRGWANYHRHVICAETFSKVDSFTWGRVYRWCKRRHPDKTGRWIAERYFLQGESSSWRFTDPDTGTSLIKIGALVKRQRHVKIQGAANPFDPEWDEYFENRDKKQVQAVTAGLMARVHSAQDGTCPVCEQVIQYEEELVLHHRDGKRKNFKLANLVYFHPNCHQQLFTMKPDSKTKSSRPSGRLSCLSRIR